MPTTTPPAVVDLVARFREQAADYRAGRYNETQLRREFVDPLFKALGWDVDNSQGYAEAYKDVIHEDAIKIGGATKAPDYCFRIGGVRKFFVEAKKPSVDIRDDAGPAFQLRRYAWSAKLPLSILTDFEELAVYDCRVRPTRADKPAVARTLYLTYEDYLTRWSELADIFSRDAILKGSFDRYAASARRKRGTAEVDDAFLAEIEQWRDSLARHLALRNPDLSQRDLNFAVQRTIDRIVFLRICEDRGIEPYGSLQALTNGERVYARLFERFRRADERYNSGLFHFSPEKGRPAAPDDLTPHLVLDDRPLKDILTRLYYPESPYEFSVLPADILGQVYEQFLGKVIRLTKGHRAVVEEKPEVRKAGGVYYTPTYIVDYIVRHTVGKLVAGRTPQDVGALTDTWQPSRAQGARPLAVLDPACGSGSFLLGAYQFLLDWYRDWYVHDDPARHAAGRRPRLFQHPSGEWRLTTAERKRILLAHIHGVDIDSQAVETTKLSLLLKVLEGESAETLGSSLRLFHERALPDLAANIKCGNSLIGPDFYDHHQMDLFDEEQRLRLNVFDWHAEFPHLMRSGGFDAVIGNPPYIRIQTLQETAPATPDYYKHRYAAAAKGNYDIYVLFVERGLGLLTDSGTLGFILPHKFFNAQYGEPVRGLISTGRHLSRIVHFGAQQVFAGATTYTCLLFLCRAPSDIVRLDLVTSMEAWRTTEHAATQEVSTDRFGSVEWSVGVVGTSAPLLDRLLAISPRLGDVASIFVGLQTSADRVYILEEVAPRSDNFVHVRDRDGRLWSLEAGAVKPFLYRVTVSTFDLPVASHWLIFPYDVSADTATLIPPTLLAARFPRTWEYLNANRTPLLARQSGNVDAARWYGYIYRKNLTLFEAPKLIVQVISLRGRYAYDPSSLYFTGGGNGPYYGVRWLNGATPLSLHYLQALLGSRVLDFCIRQISTPFRGGYWSYGKRFISLLPVKLPNTDSTADTSLHVRIDELARLAMSLRSQVRQSKTEYSGAALQRQIDATDRQIDQLVYQLYGLTEDEIRIVEDATAS